MFIESNSGGMILDVIEENYDKTGSPSIKFLCELQDINPNRNLRIYDNDCLNKIVSVLAPKSKDYGLIGELNHPFIESTEDSVIIKRTARLDLENACVAYSNIRKDGNRIIAEGKTLTHAKGFIAKSYIEDNIGNIGFSSRSLGKLRDHTHVDHNTLTPFTYDFVWLPSHKNAIITSIFNESSSYLDTYSSMEQEAVQIIELMESENYTTLLRQDENATKGDCGCVGHRCDILTESNITGIKDIMLEMEMGRLINPTKIKFKLN